MNNTCKVCGTDEAILHKNGMCDTCKTATAWERRRIVNWLKEEAKRLQDAWSMRISTLDRLIYDHVETECEAIRFMAEKLENSNGK